MNPATDRPPIKAALDNADNNLEACEKLAESIYIHLHGDAPQTSAQRAPSPSSVSHNAVAIAERLARLADKLSSINNSF